MGEGRGRGWGREGGDWLTAPLAAVKFAHSNFNVTGQWCSDPVLVKSSIREIDTWRRTTRFHPTNFRERIGRGEGENEYTRLDRSTKFEDVGSYLAPTFPINDHAVTKIIYPPPNFLLRRQTNAKEMMK